MQNIMRAIVVRDPDNGQEVFVRTIWDPINGGDPATVRTHDAVIKYLKEYCGEMVVLSDGIIDAPGEVPQDFQGLICNMAEFISNPTNKSYELRVMHFDVSSDERVLAKEYRKADAHYKSLEADDPPDFSSARDPVIVKGSYTEDFFDIFFATMWFTFLCVTLVWIAHLLLSSFNNDGES